MTGTDASAVRTAGLGKRFGASWALRECTVEIPRGRVCALVGPNGAGKTTLLRLLVGLSRPTTGQAMVFEQATCQSPQFLGDVGYLAQEAPLYRRLTGGEHLSLGARLNLRWDAASAQDRLRELGVPLDRPVLTLSGGQRAQLALALALAKNPRLLLLDEPLAALDPLARKEFLTSLALATSSADLTVLLSSHLVHDIEHVCDRLILLAEGQTQLSEDIEDVLSRHRLLVGPRRPHAEVPGAAVVDAQHTTRQTRLVVSTTRRVLDPAWEVAELTLEEIILAYMRNGAGTPQPSAAQARRAS